jgi:cytochrome oxidase Cu insertion factor (SCO1/SenC/PrrC family)
MAHLLALGVFSAGVAAMALAQDSSPYDLERVKPGEQPPDFTLPTPDGRKISLASLRGKNVVLVFYRGYW